MPPARDPIESATQPRPHTGRAVARQPRNAAPLLRCGARTRAGKTCRRPAGDRTPHLGQGKCYLHGGLSPIKHGRYSTISRPRIRELIEQHEADADPLNILPEIAALRALFQEFIERYDEQTAALIAWHLSWQLTRRPLPEDKLMAFEAIVAEWEISLAEMGEEATDKQKADAAAARTFIKILRGEDAAEKPRTVLDLTDAYRVLGEIGKMVERVEKVRNANAISRPDLNRIMHQLWRSVDTRIADEAVKAAIQDDWMRVAL